MSFSPAGYEDEFSDDEEYDGFSFGEPSPASVKSSTSQPTSAHTVTPVFTPAGWEGSDDDLDFGDSPPVSENTKWNNSPPESEVIKSSRKRPGSASSQKRVRFDEKRKTSPTKGKGGGMVDQRPREDPVSEDDFRVAVMKGTVSTVEKFIEQGVDINKEMRSGWTPIMYASTAGNSSMCELLLSKGANPNFQKDMFSVLMAACSSSARNEQDLLKCVDLLCEHGARIKAYDKYRMSPLMYAAREGHCQIVERLIEKGTDVNQQDTRGWTPLCFASSRGHVHVVKALLLANANPKIVATDGQSPSDIAYCSGFSTISDLLDSAMNPGLKINGSDVSSSLLTTAPVEESSKQAGGYVRYGDLEIFLSGLELGSLIQVFQDHLISFEALLRMTDEDLQQIGISQVGTRKKILQAIRDVHTKEWDMKSFTQQTNKQIIKAQDVSLILANASKHLKYIESSTHYIKKYLQSVKDVQEITQDVMEAQQMVDQSQESTKIAISLKNELLSLNQRIIEISDKVAKTSPDLIQDEGHVLTTRGRRWTRFVLVSAAAVTLGAMLVRKFTRGFSPEL